MESEPKPTIPADMYEAATRAWNHMYQVYRLGEKQRELYDLGYKHYDLELMTRHLDTSAKYAIITLYNMLHKYQPAN